MPRLRATLFTALLTLFLPLLGSAGTAHAAQVTIPNGVQFTDTTGAVLHAHGGGVTKVGQYYYWFGENRNADNTFKAVSAYRSTDMKTWEFRNNVLTPASNPELATANIERPKVIYNATTHKYVMWMHKEVSATDYSQARAAVAVSDTIDGNYTWQSSFRPLGEMSRDITTFVDTDGTGYMISASNNNADLHIYRLTADYTGISAQVQSLWNGQYREAPAMFKRNGVYFLLTSGATGWWPNQQKYATATSISGPWTALADAGDRTAYGSQTAFVLPVQGTAGTSYLYMGDRWGDSIGGKVKDSQYVWLPLSFPTNTTMVLPWYPQIAIDTAAGTLNGAGGGPYYNLVARHSGKCVDVGDNSAANLAAVMQWSCNGGLNQQLRFVDAGGGYVKILAQHSGKCLDVSGASTTDGADVIQYDCGSGDNQQWLLEDQGNGYYRLVARHSSKCLDVKDASLGDGGKIIQKSCGAGASQQFERRSA
ncbi:RICIN domain-containing protein [Streptomyces sp. NRRL B-24484]|uniref:RICIN domain-containing protein n=1 Tax=Streptomyces sp. NRRL B-24484 TaxID=1463833 RepID=UPI0004BF0F32|nr:RICIN domain-containing protein [Streptomyces sp. NRRL B-24484]